MTEKEWRVHCQTPQSTWSVGSTVTKKSLGPTSDPCGPYLGFCFWVRGHVFHDHPSYSNLGPHHVCIHPSYPLNGRKNMVFNYKIWVTNQTMMALPTICTVLNCSWDVGRFYYNGIRDFFFFFGLFHSELSSNLQ